MECKEDDGEDNSAVLVWGEIHNIINHFDFFLASMKLLWELFISQYSNIMVSAFTEHRGPICHIKSSLRRGEARVHGIGGVGGLNGQLH